MPLISARVHQKLKFPDFAVSLMKSCVKKAGQF